MDPVEPVRIMQRYLILGWIELRIRWRERGASTVDLKVGRGRRRVEISVPAPRKWAARRTSRGRYRVEKDRWAVGPWELDRYIWPPVADGLVVAEIEDGGMESDPIPEAPAGIEVHLEVTGEAAWSNQRIARDGFPDEATIARPSAGSTT